MSEGTVSIRIESHPGGNVAHVTIEREKKLNALSHDQAIRFMEAFDALHDVEDLRAVVLSGTGERAFMGGMFKNSGNWTQNRDEPLSKPSMESVIVSEVARFRSSAELTASAWGLVWNSPLPATYA